MPRPPKPPPLAARVAYAARAGDLAALDALAAEHPDRIGAYLPDALGHALVAGERALADALLARGVSASLAMVDASRAGRADDVAWLAARGAPVPRDPEPAPPVPTTLARRDGPFDLAQDLPLLRSFLAAQVARWAGGPLSGVHVFASAESGQITLGLSVDPRFDPVARAPALAQVGTLSLPHWAAHHRAAADDAAPRAEVLRWLAAALPVDPSLAALPRGGGFRMVLQDDDEGAVELG